jgi:hypothetical protein
VPTAINEARTGQAVGPDGIFYAHEKHPRNTVKILRIYSTNAHLGEILHA